MATPPLRIQTKNVACQLCKTVRKTMQFLRSLRVDTFEYRPGESVRATHYACGYDDASQRKASNRREYRNRNRAAAPTGSAHDSPEQAASYRADFLFYTYTRLSGSDGHHDMDVATLPQHVFRGLPSE